MTPFRFVRFVDGQEMAEGVTIERETTLESAIKKAVSLCPQRLNTVLVYVPDVAEPPKREPVDWTPRELELIDGMIEVQLKHADRCDNIRNSEMAQKQREWDLERVAILRKVRGAPPQREWVELTDADITQTMYRFARAIEAKLRSKNT